MIYDLWFINHRWFNDLNHLNQISLSLIYDLDLWTSYQVICQNTETTVPQVPPEGTCDVDLSCRLEMTSQKVLAIFDSPLVTQKTHVTTRTPPLRCVTSFTSIPLLTFIWQWYQLLVTVSTAGRDTVDEFPPITTSGRALPIDGTSLSFLAAG